jgi:hypothetical protein
MSDDPTTAMVALGRQGVNRAFEAVKRMRFSGHHHFEAFVVVISTNFALCHDWLLSVPLQKLAANAVPDPLLHFLRRLN